jgi:hypothetical protein
MLSQELRALNKDSPYVCISSSDCACSPQFSANYFKVALHNAAASPEAPLRYPPDIEPLTKKELSTISGRLRL